MKRYNKIVDYLVWLRGSNNIKIAISEHVEQNIRDNLHTRVYNTVCDNVGLTVDSYIVYRGGYKY